VLASAPMSPGRRAPRRSSPARAARSAWAWLSALAVIVTLFTNVGRLAHYLVVAHTVCSHGELVDGHAVRDSHAGEAAEQRERERAHAEPGSGPAHDDAHEHCDVAALAHSLIAPPAPVTEATLLLLLPVETGGARTAHAPTTPLTLAPKGSPPRG
jgi:hypothetical protein